MNKNSANFKVVVSDEIFDFRSLDASHSRSSTIPRTLSYSAIDVKSKKDIPIFNERHLTNLEKVAKQNSAPFLQQRYRKPKSKNRSKTVDPRFRRSRSPIPKQINASLSNHVLNKLAPSQAKSIKAFSASSPSIQTTYKEPSQEVERPKNEELYVPVIKPCIMTGRERNFMEGNESNYRNMVVDEENYFSTLNYVGDINFFGTESVDDVTFETHATTKIPYWDDPRVSLHKKSQQQVTPVRSHSVLSLKKLQCSGVIMCRKDETDMDNQSFSAYKYDDVTEICSCSLLSENINFRKTHFKGSSYVIPYMILGSLLGLIVVSFIVWLINWNFSLSNLWQRRSQSTIEENNLIVYCVKSVVVGIIRGLDTLYTKTYQLLVLQRQDLFNHRDPNPRNPWWRNII